MAFENKLDYSTKRKMSKEAWLRRLEGYWTTKNFPRVHTHVGEIYETVSRNFI